MKKILLILSIIASVGVATAPRAAAARMAVKVSGDIGLGKGMSLSPALPGMTAGSASNAFGVDFGYSFWQLGGSSLEANIGLGYRMASATFRLEGLSYDYSAPASADEDGNPYRRYTQLADVSQKISLGYLSIPIYLQYQYRATGWLGIHAGVGFGLGFRCGGSVGTASGSATSYGVYPEYDDLVIKEDYLNDFGTRSLADASVGNADMKGFSASVLCGAGLEFYVADPVSIDLGVRYSAGLTDVFAGHYDITSPAAISAESAPVTYTVASGRQMKALSDYVTKSRLAPLSLHIGLNIRF